MEYKNLRPGEPVESYHGRGYVTLKRAVHSETELLVPGSGLYGGYFN